MGRYLVRGGPVETLEGGWTSRTIIVVEFTDLERARTWYRSPEHAEALTVGDEALSRNLILVPRPGDFDYRGCLHCRQRCEKFPRFPRFPQTPLVAGREPTPLGWN